MIMARVRVKVGDSEIEIDSRDFYIDNDTVHEVIDELIKCLPEPKTRPVYRHDPQNETLVVSDDDSPNSRNNGTGYESESALEPLQAADRLNACLGGIKEAEAREPEFEDDYSNDDPIHSHLQIREGLQALRGAGGFLDSPRTVHDVVRKLQDDGWLTNSRTVSQVLTEMADCKEIARNSSSRGNDNAAVTYVSYALS